MGFWKTFCTCAGCVAGAACIILSGGTATPLVTAVAIGIGGTAGHLTGSSLERKEKKAQNTEKELQIKQQTIDSITKENQTKQAEIDNLKQKREELANQKKPNPKRPRKCQKQS